MRATFAKLVSRLVVVGVVAVACGRGASSTETPSAVVVTVGPNGGFVAGPGVTVAIPAGALSSEVAITVSDDGVPPPGYAITGKVYRFLPAGLRFSVPVTVTMPGAAPSLMFWTLEGSEDRFTALGTTYGAGEARADVTHFSSGFVGLELVASDAAADATADAPAADASCGATGTWPIDAGGAGVCPPASPPIPACPDCGVSEEVYCDTVCPVVNGPTRCVDSKTDPKHCGGCFSACGANEVCNDGGTTTRKLCNAGCTTALYARFVVDNCGLYWAIDRSIWRLLPDDTRLRRISWAVSAGSASSLPRRVAVDDKHLYWTDETFIGRVAK